MNMLAPVKPEILALPEPARIDCTLYELIDTLIDESGPGQEALVVSVVLDLMFSGRMTRRHSPSEAKCKRSVQPGAGDKNRSVRSENLCEMRA